MHRTREQHTARVSAPSRAPAPPGPARPPAARSRPAAAGRPPVPRLASVGTAVPSARYTQQDVLDLFRVRDPRIASLFLNGGIERRHLSLPPPGPDGTPRQETQGELLARHSAEAVRLGRAAVEECLRRAGAAPADVRHLCCVTSTGLLTPGLSALLVKEMGLSPHCSRLDVVGMGCNAGLNALSATAGWAAAHPGGLAVMACIEVCSAAYVFDGTMRTSVVNSLFGDGAAAVAVVAPDGAASGTAAGDQATPGPGVLRFASRVIPDAIAAMRYDWDDAHGRFSFFLDPEVPYVVGAHVEDAVRRLLDGTGLARSDIGHWVIHSGGRKVIDSVRVNLGLTRHDVRHTSGVLRDLGNVSSGSFLFSYRRLLDEGAAQPGDHGVMITMGPGSTIETALLRW
ncbi:3,5-dihydroxyphenylacetyl-CoA synthase DpgA [Streptomyces cyaneogriseus]|uniref:3,5-dihydroxyphenylacetyl-CoA synthase DpgA n=1 Tax=Streptomyces cyaneogriseus TaxID=68192 RepID=UPI00099E1272|nr:3,5-dihydroxyphenylacetyl-CoA synthase DpgA [Streptomyces cyaneogriseus]